MKILGSVSLNPEKAEATQKIDNLVKSSSEVLYRAKNFFPFDLFPDEIIVMRQRVDIVYGLFFSSKEILSIEIKNLFDVNLDFDLLFAAIDFKLTVGQEEPGTVKFLKKREAIELRRIVVGLIAAYREKIDISSLTKEELLPKLIEIGKARQQ
ncbi:MAG: hypothetical protein ABIO02_02000 [Patescibacteria group bacterium]